MADIEQLGVVTCPSGTLLVIDTGYLAIWSHDGQPILPEGILDTEEARDRANAFVDIRIAGADAEQAGRMLAMSSHPTLIFDQPPDHPELDKKLADLKNSQHLDAHFEVISPRVPHRQRVNLTIERAGAGEVQFHGIPAVAVSDVPPAETLPVLGVRLTDGARDNWSRVWISCRPERPIRKAQKVGVVGVDYARLMVADVNALGAWKHEESLDGLADFVFWGRDAQQTADALHATRLSEDEFGWTNVAEEFAQERGFAVQELIERKSLMVQTDYRPHSHHWRVMRPTRISATESGTVEFGGAVACNFMTSWGDGLFDVYRDLDEEGTLVQIRIQFGQA